MDVTSATRLAALLGNLADDRLPRYAALAARVRLLVSDGRLPVGVRLPAERDLAAAAGVSRVTVTAAYRRLREDGWAVARQGAGTWTALPAGAVPGAWVPEPAGGALDLAHAAPSAPPQVHASFAAALADLPRLLPGHGYFPQGLPELRARIADKFTARGLPTTAEHVLVTSGALHAIVVALDVLARRGTRVLVEHPSYPNALDAIRARGARLVPVPVDADDPAGLVAAAQRTARATAPALAYLMPDFQNPTGLLLDERQRARLAAALHVPGTVALVDETLADLPLDVPAPPPYAAGARSDRAVTVGSLSKSCWGGLRIGWLRAEPDLVQRFTAAAVRAHMSTPVLEQLAACHVLDNFAEMTAVRRDALRVQRDALVGALAARLPDWRVRVPAGGLVLWCQLPGAMSNALVEAAARRDVRLAAGSRFGAGNAFDDRLRLPYTQPADVLVRAVEVLREAAADVSDRAPATSDALVV